MLAIFLAPVYILANVFTAYWLLRWMKEVHPLFRHPAVLGVILVLYAFFALSLLTSFLIKRDPVHRILKVISNCWLGMYLYFLGFTAILVLRGLPGSILVKIVHAYGGILGPAHPYGEKFMSMISTNERKKKYQQRIAQLLPQFDFVEIFNACESAETNAKAKRLAEKFNKPGFGGSDAHRLNCIGKAYTELPDTIRSEDDLIAYVKTCPQIECGGEHYNGTTKDRIGRLNMVLVDSFYFYNKLANGWRWRKRRRELFDIIEKKL